MHLIQNVQKRGQLTFAIQSIHIVVDGDIADTLAGEIDFRILPGKDVVPTQAGQILGDYAVDFPVLDVVDHPLKTGAVIVCAGPAVVHVLAYHMKAMVPRVGLKHGALRLDADALPLLLIVMA